MTSSEDEPIVIRFSAAGGMMNPDAHIPCGARDASAKFPEPAHLSCRRCHRLILKMLEGRGVVPAPEPEVEQLKLWE
jgi:hypothetical protein